MNKKKSLFIPLAITLALAGCGGQEGHPTSSDGSIQESYAISVEAGEGATVTGLPTEAKEGETVTFKVNLAEEKELTYVTIDGENTLDPDQNGVYSFLMPKAAVKVSAITADKRYAIEVEQAKGATLSLSSNLAKKGETIQVRVTIGDETKVSPDVKVGEGSIEMSAVADERKTFAGSFVNPGVEGLKVTMTLTDAPVAFAIEDTSGDGAFIDGPKTAVPGEKVTFRVGLEPGFEEDGEVIAYKKGDEVTTVPVTKNDDGTYSFIMPVYAVALKKKTTKATYRVSYDGDADKFTALATDIPLFAAYESTVEFAITENDDYAVDTLKLGDTTLTKGENGKYSFTMPSHSVALHITAKVNYIDLTLTNSDHITLKAYSKNGGTYNEVANLNEIKISEQVNLYVKPEIKDTAYGLDTLTIKRDGGKEAEVTANDEGYYPLFAETKAKAIQVAVKEATVMLQTDHILLGMHQTYKFSYSGIGLATYNLAITNTGKVSAEGSTLRLALNEEAKTFTMTQEGGTSSNKKTYTGGYFGNGLIYFFTTTTPGSALYLRFCLSNKTDADVTEKKCLLDDSYSSAKKVLTQFKVNNETFDVFTDLTNSSNPTVKLVTLEYLNENKDFATPGSAFTLKAGDTVLGTYKNKSGKLVEAKTATYSGKLGDITVDGLGKVTLKKEGQEDKTGTYTEYDNKENSLILTFDEQKYAIYIDGSSYAYLPYSAGTYHGKKVGGTEQDDEEAVFNEDFTLTSSNGNKSLTFQKDGSFYSSNLQKTYFFGEGENTLVAYKSEWNRVAQAYVNTYYVLSKTPSKDNVGFKSLTGQDGSFLATIWNTADTGPKKSSVYFDGKTYYYGTVSADTYDTDGTKVDFTSGEHTFHLLNQSGKLLTYTPDEFEGTYQESGSTLLLGDLVLNGTGFGKWGEEAISYIAGSDASIEVTITSTEELYTVTLDTSNKTYNATKKVVPTTIAGKTFVGKVSYESSSGGGWDDYSYDEYASGATTETENLKITFDATKFTLTFANDETDPYYFYLQKGSIKYGISSDGKEITVATVDGAGNPVTLKFKIEGDETTTKLVFDSTEDASFEYLYSDYYSTRTLKAGTEFSLAE